jgi:hypothetical protein
MTIHLQASKSQQTLNSSFTVGGIGLHSGEYGEFCCPENQPRKCTPQQPGFMSILRYSGFLDAATVRVRPASAGEGRYFVRMPQGTISHLFELDKPFPVDPRNLKPDGGPVNEIRSAAEAQLFIRYLKAQDLKQFDGTFPDFVDAQSALKSAPPKDDVADFEEVTKFSAC